MATTPSHYVVIVGGDCGGLYATRALRRIPLEITLIDRCNSHLFQPLPYHVATGGLSPGEIALPLRAVLKRQKRTRVWLAEVLDLDAANRRVRLADGEIAHDTLIVAAGTSGRGHDILPIGSKRGGFSQHNWRKRSLSPF